MPVPSTVNQCMRRNPLTIHKEDNLVQAIEMIVDNKLTGLTVTDDEGHIVGILSELDCLQGVLSAIYNEGDPEHALVGEAMSTDIATCESQDSIVEVGG